MLSLLSILCRLEDGEFDSSSSELPQRATRKKKYETSPHRADADQSQSGSKENEMESDELVKQLQTVGVI